MNTWLVCFDIEDDRARTRVGKALLRYGERVQESVFEIVLRGEEESATLRARLAQIAGRDANVRLYRVCAECRQASHTLGKGPVMVFPAALIL